MEKLLVSTKEAAELLGIGRSTFYQIWSNGKLLPRPIMFNSKKVWSVEELKEWVRWGCPKNLTKYKKIKKKRREESKEKILALCDSYVKNLLCHNTNLKSKDLPIELVKTKRVHLKFKRYERSLRNETEKEYEGIIDKSRRCIG